MSGLTRVARRGFDSLGETSSAALAARLHQYLTGNGDPMILHQALYTDDSVLKSMKRYEKHGECQESEHPHDSREPVSRQKLCNDSGEDKPTRRRVRHGQPGGQGPVAREIRQYEGKNRAETSPQPKPAHRPWARNTCQY